MKALEQERSLESSCPCRMRIVSAYLRVSLSKALGYASRPALKITRRRRQETPSIQHPLPREDHEPCANDKSIRSLAAFRRASSAPRVQPLEHYVPKVVWENRFDMSAKYTNNIKSTERAGSASNVVISMGSGHVAFRLAGFKIPRDRLLIVFVGAQCRNVKYASPS